MTIEGVDDTGSRRTLKDLPFFVVRLRAAATSDVTRRASNGEEERYPRGQCGMRMAPIGLGAERGRQLLLGDASWALAKQTNLPFLRYQIASIQSYRSKL